MKPNKLIKFCCLLAFVFCTLYPVNAFSIPSFLEYFRDKPGTGKPGTGKPGTGKPGAEKEEEKEKKTEPQEEQETASLFEEAKYENFEGQEPSAELDKLSEKLEQ
jgi:hypothetical protein